MNGAIVLTTPEQIQAFRLLSLRGRFRLEVRGFKFKGRSTFACVKKEFGLKGTKVEMLAQFEAQLREKGILR